MSIAQNDAASDVDMAEKRRVEPVAARVAQVRDLVGERTRKLFAELLQRGDMGRALDRLRNPERNTLTVSFTDIEAFSQPLAQVLLEDYYRVSPHLSSAVDEWLKRSDVASSVSRQLFVGISNVPIKIKMRELNGFRVGKLVRITVQVVRAHPVHPELVRGAFLCAECHTLVPAVEQQFKYTQPAHCANEACPNRSNFELVPTRSVFVDFQKIRVQETQDELPRGNIPRSLEVVLRGELVERCQPGDRVDLCGTLIVVPQVAQLLQSSEVSTQAARPAEGYNVTSIAGLKSLGVRELGYKLAFLACSVAPASENKMASMWRGQANAEETTDAGTRQALTGAEIIRSQMSEEEWQRVYEMSRDRNIYTNLCRSLFPTVYGNEEIKQGLLLQLLGGVQKQTADGTRLRGDINVCLVGDPSTAKSQFLKTVSEFCPRAVYTSGKASTAAGLTAAVVRDEETYEFVIEAGALILADNGICCIDEFDKMDVRDQVAIHEAMEQQTVSIAKAGVRATLNARASVLAAANPIGGRYDRSKPLKYNVALSAPLMSRFDLFFVLIDQSNEVVDYAVARRIVDLHMKDGADHLERTYSPEDMARYVAFARQFKPKVTPKAMKLLVQYYRKMRDTTSHGMGSSAPGSLFGGRSAWRVTIRQLESMVRLSEALAKLYCVDEVEETHVQEAFRLLNKSIVRVEQPDVQLEAHAEGMTLPEPPLTEKQPTGDGEEAEEADRPSLSLSFEDYQRLGRLLVGRLQQLEERCEADGGDPEAATQMRRSALVNWYLETVLGEELESEREVIERKLLVESVIDSLVLKDHVLIEILAAPAAAAKGAEGAAPPGDAAAGARGDPMLLVHPNYQME